MKANIRIEGDRVLIVLDLPLDQVSPNKIDLILGEASCKTQSQYAYPKRVCDDPLTALADMFRSLDTQGVLVTEVYFPAAAKPVMEKLDFFDSDMLWGAQCTFTPESNYVVVVGGDIQTQVPWE